ncbi:hypothetical protein FHS51_004063 [Sphingobium wenxiniae]|uniref:hypothetical protein n=1 Tax=Sphingobium wenxiniae (strain DSM 21828 / CGMCC 1.7748 / JZ-1) TaxID=595605 RepID=UPI0011A00EA1|nr:hypothetical protein [Sphingobium wenxiniae]MBB6193805.1 hypothetical protein [Sphingobium wenxiniae]
MSQAYYKIKPYASAASPLPYAMGFQRFTRTLYGNGHADGWSSHRIGMIGIDVRAKRFAAP